MHLNWLFLDLAPYHRLVEVNSVCFDWYEVTNESGSLFLLSPVWGPQITQLSCLILGLLFLGLASGGEVGCVVIRKFLV